MNITQSSPPPIYLNEQIPAASAALEQTIQRGGSLHEVSMAYCKLIVARHGGNFVHAAKSLDVDRRTLQRWNLRTSI
jgi:hypothetical protein